MSNRDREFYIVDILIAYNKITRYIRNCQNAQDLLYNEMAWDAVIRELEIIGEATKYLIDDILDKDYRVVVNFRNQIAHGYFGIDEDIVWEVVTQKLNKFIQELLDIVQKNELQLDEAIECAIEENFYNKDVVVYLKQVRELLKK